MCGVFGWVSRRRPLTPHELAAARAATAKLAHRGPDYGGEWVTDRVFMGHRRLSIIDLSQAAHQPFIGTNESIILSFNGEIYNYLELRRDLSGEGCAFVTSSDTEVLSHAFERRGIAAFDDLDGMYAGAVHDRRTGQHMIFRDPLGQKPLYYFLSDDHLIYASELRSLLTLEGMAWTLDRAAFERFLANGYYCFGDTPIIGIRKLQPGHYLTLDDRGLHHARFWQSKPGDDVVEISDDDAIEALGQHLKISCQRALRSDVPFGVLLSGGIDSSVILSYCHEISPDVQAISVAMAEPDFDESAKAKEVVERIGVHRHNIVTMDERAVVDTMSGLLVNNDEPHGDPGFVNARFLAGASKPLFSVGLSGDGGDELFYGYAPFNALAVRPFMRAMPHSIIALCKYAIGLLPASDTYLSLRFKLESLLRSYPSADGLDLALWLTALDMEGLARLLPEHARYFNRTGCSGTIFAELSQMFDVVGTHTPPQKLAYFYQQVFLPEFVCMHTDRAAMQVALEVRSPFLSPDLIRFANSLPDHLKYRNGVGKWVLRRLAQRRGLGTAIAKQRKQGFTLPLARWLKTSLRGKMLSLLDSGSWAMDGLVDLEFMRELVTQHLEGRSNNYRILYNLLAFRAWREQYPSVKIGSA